VQLFGSCKETKGILREKAEKTYGLRFKGFSKWKSEIEKEEGEFSLRFYRFLPKKAKILDEPLFGGGVFIDVSFSK
jgi:hypothetical protein